MKILLYIISVIFLVSSSCAGTSKRMKKSNPAAKAGTTAITEKIESAAPIREVEEKLVAIDEIPPNPDHYFVIIGSFRNPDNARKHQTQISKDGFRSEILKNDQGLFRVAVMSSDDINSAREEIRRIRNLFPLYSDTWLLISKR